MTNWQPIDTMPEDENVLVAAGTDWVFTAHMLVNQDTGAREFFHSLNGRMFHRNHAPVAWMPLPDFPKEMAP